MNKTKLVTFTPTNAFFFGGETTFGNGDGRNFFAPSNYFPQQTTLVGVIRHALYEAGQKQNFGNSFMVGTVKPDYGWLEKLSPVFIHKDGEIGIPIQLPKTKKIEMELSEIEIVYFNDTALKAPIVKDYSGKSGVDSHILMNAELKSYDDIFIEVSKIGIARDRILHTNLDGMFYKQKLYKMENGFSFGVYVTGTDELFEILHNRNMPMGGEKVNFTIQVHEEGGFNVDLGDKISKNKDFVFLTSDAFVTSDIYQYCQFAISETRSFRNIVTPTSTTDWGNLSKENSSSQRYKSEKFTLLARGTVLFPKDDISQITNALKNENFEKIGYNQFIINQTKQS